MFNVESGPPLSENSEQFHVSISFIIALATPFNPTFARTCYGKGDFESLGRELAEMDWAVLFEKKNSKKKSLWILKNQTRSRVKSMVDEYNAVRCDVKKATKRSVIDYERSIIYDNTKKRLYAYAKFKQATSKKISAMKNSLGVISNILNAYFKSVFVIEDTKTPLPDFAEQTTNCILNASPCFIDISNRLSKLDPYKAPGVDGIHSRVLKSCHSAMEVPLAQIYTIPDLW